MAAAPGQKKSARDLGFVWGFYLYEKKETPLLAVDLSYGSFNEVP